MFVGALTESLIELRSYGVSAGRLARIIVNCKLSNRQIMLSGCGRLARKGG